MNYLVMVFAGLLAFCSHASEPTNQQQCEEWALMDGVSDEDMGTYLNECLYNLELPEEDLSVEEEILTAELSDQDPE